MEIKILVAGAPEPDRMIIQAALPGYAVLTAGSSEEAIRVLEENDGINLLILDLTMPGERALQPLEFLQTQERYSKVRSIIMTGPHQLDTERKGLALGAVDCLRKPLHRAGLKARIDLHAALLRAEHALKKREQDRDKKVFEILFEQAPIGIAISHNAYPQHPNEALVKINPMYEQITGRTKEELITLGWAAITHPEDVAQNLKYWRQLQAGEIKSYSMDKRFVRPDGSTVWVHMVVSPLILADNNPYNHICLVQDITERKEMEKALYESERSKSVFLAHLPGLAYRCNFDREWTMQYVSDGCYQLTGYPPESLLHNRDLSYNDLMAPEYREKAWEIWIEATAKKQPIKYEYEIITATGERKWVLEMGQPIYNDRGEVEALEGIVLDISDRKAMEDTLKYNSEHDPWTGLYNREYLISLLEKDLKERKRAKIALIGVNLSTLHLLTVNYGFQYAQNLVKRAAEGLSYHATDKRILCQSRENNFVFYLRDYRDKKELLDFCHALVQTLEDLFVTERIGGGIGILEVEPDRHEVDIDELFRRLLIASEKDVTLFDKDFKICCYDEVLEASVTRERTIMEALHAIAMGEETGDELFLQYQPIADLHQGSIVGFEALARLRTEKLGLVSPAEFIPIAEKTKLIIPLGEKIIVKALCFLKKLKKHGYDHIHVSINISVIQLLQPNFTGNLFALINQLGINPRNVGIEITESVFVSEYDTINSSIEELRRAGLHIAIDDFGTGYSSLVREKELKADCMKIDKYFIDELLGTNLHKTITVDIISISHKLGHYTIAEGVEHPVQLKYLKQYNCDRVQGYLISKPLDEDEAIAFLRNHIQLGL
ncbi:MAG TPA: EAL domain-containing protein [Clostridia bacterium]|nr:EAL domain-containing protein [Clostridia bacterium]